MLTQLTSDKRVIMVAAQPRTYSAEPGEYGRLLSVSRRSPGISPAAALRTARGLERFYWADGSANAAAGFGIAAELIAWGPDRFDTLRRKLERLFSGALVDADGDRLRLVRVFGGFAFQDDFVPDRTWSIYTPAYFILPHYQVTEAEGETWLTLNAHLAPDDDPDEALDQLRGALDLRYEALLRASRQATPPSPVEVRQVSYPMPYDVWEQIITEATTRIQHGMMHKVVLSRVCEIRLAGSVDVDAALAYLESAYPDCYRFLFEPRPHHVFYGATPELLVRAAGRQLETMALAGSSRRGQTPQEDEAYADALLGDPKERHEHALVVNALRDRLTPVSESLDIPETPTVLKLSNIQHLYTPVRATLRQPMGVLPLAERLHPTPALGGEPREAALTFIRQAEPVPRGWYAAPIGWVDHRLDGVFAVAIRSAVSQDDRVWLYAGAGIVANSQPRQEWEETALKFRPMLNALGIQGVA